MKTAEQIASTAYVDWVNCTCVGDCQEKYVQIITAALKEYGELVRQRAAFLCLNRHPCGNWETEGLGQDAKITGWHEHATHKDCAAAIERMELP